MNKKHLTLVAASLILAFTSSHSFARDDYNAASADCQLPNKEDSYKLALSWQPAFCESHKSKPECKITDHKSYQASHFTLHGLWPNKHECGIDYGMCGQYKQPVDSFCDYEPIPMKPETVKVLGEVMPSVAQGSCLDRHEWYKHGTCQTDWNADGYFDTAVRLTKEFNDKGMSEFMRQNTGKTVATAAFLGAVDLSLGEGASQRLNLSCDKQGNLVDVFINLPKQIPENVTLADLIKQAPKNFNNRCGKSFKVDAIGFDK